MRKQLKTVWSVTTNVSTLILAILAIVAIANNTGHAPKFEPNRVYDTGRSVVDVGNGFKIGWVNSWREINHEKAEVVNLGRQSVRNEEVFATQFYARLDGAPAVKASVSLYYGGILSDAGMAVVLLDVRHGSRNWKECVGVVSLDRSVELESVIGQYGCFSQTDRLVIRLLGFERGHAIIETSLAPKDPWA